MLADGYDIRKAKELQGHKGIRTTVIYVHVLNRGGHGVRSPLTVSLDKALRVRRK